MIALSAVPAPMSARAIFRWCSITGRKKLSFTRLLLTFQPGLARFKARFGFEGTFRFQIDGAQLARSDNGELAAAKARATARRAEPDEAAAEAQREGFGAGNRRLNRRFTRIGSLTTQRLSFRLSLGLTQKTARCPQ
jgi:hypothetical protein